MKDRYFKLVKDGKGRDRLIPADLRNFELIPTGICQDAKQILKDEAKKKGKCSVRDLL